MTFWQWLDEHSLFAWVFGLLVLLTLDTTIQNLMRLYAARKEIQIVSHGDVGAAVIAERERIRSVFDRD